MELLKNTPFISIHRNGDKYQDRLQVNQEEAIQDLFGSHEIKELFSNGETDSKAYKYAYNQFRAFNNDNPITVYRVALYLKHMADTGFKWNTINTAHCAISHISDVTLSRKDLKVLKKTMFSKDPEKVHPKSQPPLSRKVLIRKLSNAMVRDRVLLSVGWFASLRVSELISIKKKDLVKRNGYYILTIPESKNYERGQSYNKKIVSQDKKQTCPVALLDSWLAQFSGNDYIFPGRFGKGHLTRSSAHRVVKKIIGKKYSCHSLRSGSLTHAIEKGATIEEQMNLTGHRSSHSLRSYNRSSIITNNAADLLT